MALIFLTFHCSFTNQIRSLNICMNNCSVSHLSNNSFVILQKAMFYHLYVIHLDKPYEVSRLIGIALNCHDGIRMSKRNRRNLIM